MTKTKSLYFLQRSKKLTKWLDEKNLPKYENYEKKYSPQKTFKNKEIIKYR